MDKYEIAAKHIEEELHNAAINIANEVNIMLHVCEEVTINRVLEIINEKHDDFRDGTFRDNSITYMQAWKRSNEAIREAVERLKGGEQE